MRRARSAKRGSPWTGSSGEVKRSGMLACFAALHLREERRIFAELGVSKRVAAIARELGE